MDKSAPAGAMGMLFNEDSAAAYTTNIRPLITNYIYGLGGRDMTQTDLKEIFIDAKEMLTRVNLQHHCNSLADLEVLNSLFFKIGVNK